MRQILDLGPEKRIVLNLKEPNTIVIELVPRQNGGSDLTISIYPPGEGDPEDGDSK
jgi:hypothetical protein